MTVDYFTRSRRTCAELIKLPIKVGLSGSRVTSESSWRNLCSYASPCKGGSNVATTDSPHFELCQIINSSMSHRASPSIDLLHWFKWQKSSAARLREPSCVTALNWYLGPGLEVIVHLKLGEGKSHKCNFLRQNGNYESREHEITGTRSKWNEFQEPK